MTQDKYEFFGEQVKRAKADIIYERSKKIMEQWIDGFLTKEEANAQLAELGKKMFFKES